ncbi:MAG: Hpt domain-containing protein [Fidelibacterota bacterium]
MENDLYNDPEFQKLIREYLDYLKDLQSELKRNIDDSNYNEIRKFGHKLTGSGGGYGFNDLTELGKKINLAAKAEDDELLQKLSKKLEENINEKLEVHSA